jgi:hypothetical protein
VIAGRCTVVDAVPADLDVARCWDLAATEKTAFNDPDWTVGIDRFAIANLLSRMALVPGSAPADGSRVTLVVSQATVQDRSRFLTSW